MKRFATGMLSLLVLLLSACGHTPVWVATDDSVSFSGPQTYAWRAGVNSPERDTLQQALQKRLSERGWTEVQPDQARFLADATVYVEQREQARALPMGGTGRYRSDVYWEPYLVQWHVFWLIDPAVNESVWEAKRSQRIADDDLATADARVLRREGGLNLRREIMQDIALQLTAELP